MKKIFLLILGFVMFKVGYSQYPIQQFIGADSAVVTSKGGLQGRFINVVFADTTAANSQRVRQYPGAMIYASGKLWVRNTTATGWTELAYGPITPVNIYNSDGTLTGPRTLDGNNDDLTFDNVAYFTVTGNPLGQIRFYQGSNSNILMRGDTTAISRRLSYNTNLGSSFTKHSVVDKNYVDSSITASPSGTVTSVGLSMPTAFVVTNSPVISSGTLTVTGAGVASQYIRGDGQLATLPTTGGGGSSVSYYLNGSVNQGTFGGTPYYEMSKTAIFGAGTDFTISSNGYIASFITDAGDPALLNIPAGNWDFEVYFQSSSASGTPSFYVELYKYDGTTFTLIASSSANPKFITNGTSVDAYYTPLAVPSTSLLVTDRLAVRIYVNNSGNTITLHTEDNNLCQIITTFSTGINALNGLTSQVQYLATGTSGTDFNINSATDTHTFNLPTASATNRGALNSADWSTFNSKIGPSDTASMLSNYVTNAGYGLLKTTKTLSVDTLLISTRAWRQKGIDSVASLANSKIDGSGTTNYVSKFTASGTIGNSQIFDNGTNVGIRTASPSSTLELYKATGPNYLYLTNGASGSLNGVLMRYNSVDYMGMTGNVNSGEFKIGGFNAAGYFMTFYSNNAERMRLTPSGRLLIGTSTESTYELDVVGDIRSTLDANINGLTVGKGGGSVSQNTAFGVTALASNTTGNAVTAIGYQAGNANTGSSHNTYIGNQSGPSATGANNTFVGSGSGFVNAGGAQNTFIGTFSGYEVTSGTYNTTLGYNTGRGITTGNYNTIIGAQVTGLSSSLSNTIILADGQGNQRLYIDNSGYSRFTTTNSNTIRLQDLVGATTFAALYLDQTTPSLTNYAIASDGTNTLVNAASTSVNLRVGNSDRAVVYSNGNLSSGTLPADIGFSLNLTSAGSSGLIRAGNFTYGVGGRFVHFNYGDETQTSSNYSIYYESGDLIFNTKTGGVFKYRINNTDVGRIFTNGNFFIGSSPVDGGYKLDVSGTTRISGTELRLDNATTGTINLYSNTPRVNFFSSGGYWVGRNATTLEIVSGGTIIQYIGGNQAYQIDGSNGHVFRSAISGSAALARLTTGGNLIVGGTTDAGFKFDVIGTSRLNGNVTIGASTLILSNQEANQVLRITAPIGIQISSDKWISITSSSSYIQNGFTTKNFVSTTQSNGNFASFDFSNSNSYTPTIANPYTQKLINGAMTINSTAATNSFHGVSISTTDNSASIANNVFAVYANATLGTNTSATRWAGYFIGRGYFSEVLAIGTTSPNASALLDITSTTKGFLPPRMTTAQKNAITSPATGLVVYDTTLNKLCVYTGAGWETVTSL